MRARVVARARQDHLGFVGDRRVVSPLDRVVGIGNQRYRIRHRIALPCRRRRGFDWRAGVCLVGNRGNDRLRDVALEVSVVFPRISRRRFLDVLLILLDRCQFRPLRHHERSRMRPALQRQAEPVPRAVSGRRHFDVAVNHAIALHRHAHRRIARVPANVERKPAGRVRVDRRVVDHDLAVVVAQRVRRGVVRVVQRQLHPLQRQVAVVLDQHLRVLGVDCPVLERDLVVLQQLECLRLRPRRADQRAVHRVREAREVNRQTLRAELALRRLQPVARAAGQQRDRVAVHRRVPRRLQRAVLRAADLRHVLDGRQRAGAVAVGDPLEVRGSRLRERVGLGHLALLRRRLDHRRRSLVDDDVPVHRAARERQAEAVLRVGDAARLGRGHLDVAVDHGVAGHRHAHRRIARVPANVERKPAGRVRVDRRVVDHDLAVVVAQRVRRGVVRVVQRQLHPLQRQVAVVLDQHLRVLGVDCPVLERDLVVLQQLECLRLRPRRTHQVPVHRVREPVEVDRQPRLVLALRDLDSVTGAVAQHRDRLTVRGRRERFRQRRIARRADGGDGVGGFAGEERVAVGAEVVGLDFEELVRRPVHRFGGNRHRREERAVVRHDRG